MKAIGMYIFGGSQTIGHLKAGWEIDQVLEMTDNMKEINSYHFVRNYPDINVRLPEEWRGKLGELKGQYDLLFANPPCSGLSSINRNANVNNSVNKHIYEVIDAIDEIEPKMFLIENAPTLTALGLPILQDAVKKLEDKYKFTIINDIAGNHNVPMYRRRTFVIGFNKSYFSGMPTILQKVSAISFDDCIKNIKEGTKNMEFDYSISDGDKELMRFYHLVHRGTSLLLALAENFNEIKDQLTEKELRQVSAFIDKLNTKDSVWDKSPFRTDVNQFAPSLASVVRIMHPTEDRDLYIREYARLMGYPDDFEFFNGCKVPIIQCIAQGVPVNFINYISSELMSCLNEPTYTDDCDVLYINQVSGIQKKTRFSYNEFYATYDIRKNAQTIEEISLF